MKFIHLFASATILASIGLSSPANAATYGPGGSATFQYYAYGSPYDNLGSPTMFATPGSASFYNFVVTAAGNQLTYQYTQDTTWSASSTSYDDNGVVVANGSVIFSGGGIPAITGATLNAASMLGSSGFSQSNVTFNSGAVGVSWENLSFHVGDTVILDVTSNDTGAVPEPATWGLMIAGFGLVGATMRRRSVAVRFA